MDGVLGKCSRCGKGLLSGHVGGICSACQGVPLEPVDAETMKLWADSLAPETTSKDSIRSGGWHVLSDSLPPPSARSLGTLDSTTPGPVDFEIRQKLGAGGMGVVYTAHQASINRKVALKMVKPEHAASASAAEALMSEAVVTGCLDHPNVVPVYDLGVDGEGRVFYAMKEVEGHPWSVLISEKTLDENLDILLRVADTISFAHSKGILHRDLKPQNIMLGAFGEIMVMDWGAACSLGGANVVGLLPSDTAYCGTPAYMAPEMAKADKNRLGEASDVYLLGAILYQIITGHPPRREKDPLLCLLAAAENQIDPVEEDGELLRIALQAMATAPADRYPDAKSFQEALREYRSHSESLSLLANSKANLDRAKEEQDYELFNRAVYGLREALALWEHNFDARELLKEAILNYAQCAFARSDYELAQSLLNENEAGHATLLGRIKAAITERDSRKSRVRRLMVVARTLLVLTALVFAAAFFMVRAEQKETETQKKKVVAEHRQSLVNLISAHYGVRNYEATVATFWEFYDQYGMAGLGEETLLDVRVAAAMNPYRGSIDSGVRDALEIMPSNEAGCVWVVGKVEMRRIRFNPDTGGLPDTVVSIHDFKFGKRKPRGEILETIKLPASILSGEAVHKSADGTLWAGGGSWVYRFARAENKWIPVLDMSQLEYPPLPRKYNIDRAAVEEWMDSKGRKLPITGILLNQSQTHAAVALGPNTVCWVDLENNTCCGWLAVGHGTRFGGLLTGGSEGRVSLALSPDEDRLAYVSPVLNQSLQFSFQLPSMVREFYSYNRDRPVCAISYDPSGQLYASLATGYLFAPDEAYISSFNEFYMGNDYQNKVRWGTDRCEARDLLRRNIILSAFSAGGRECFNLTADHYLFSMPGSTGTGSRICHRIVGRPYIDCHAGGDGKLMLLGSDGILYLYEMQDYSIEAIPHEGKINDLCRGWRPDNLLVVMEDGKSNSVAVVDISTKGKVGLETLLETGFDSVCCDPKGHWFATVKEGTTRVYNRGSGEDVLHFSIRSGDPSTWMRFDSAGEYFCYGGGWHAGIRLFRTDSWDDLLSITFGNTTPARFTDMVMDHFNGDLTLLLTRGEPKKLQSYSIHSGQSPSLDWTTSIESSPLSIIPFTDPGSGKRKYWCGLWQQEFKLFDAETGKPSAMQVHWELTGIRHPDFVPNDPRVLFHATDGGIEIMLRSDLYPILDPRILGIKVNKAVLNKDATQLFLLGEGKLYTMQLPDLEIQE